MPDQRVDEQTSEPLTLDYQHRPVATVNAARYSPGVTFWVAVNALLGMAMLLAVFFVDYLGPIAGAMIACGVLLLVATLGCMSSDGPRFGRALVFLLGAAVLSAVSFWANREHAEKLSGRSSSRWVTPAFVSADDTRLACVSFSVFLCGCALFSTCVLAGYCGYRLRVIRLARRANS